MRKLLVLTCALMLVSSMAFGARKPASASTKSPADLVAFPDAGKFWVGLAVDSVGNNVKPENGDKVSARKLAITPSVEYAINNKFAVIGKIGFETGKLPDGDPKSKITGITNPTIGVVYRAIDCASSKQALNVGLNISPTLGKKVLKGKPANEADKYNAISGKNVFNLNVAYARPVGPVVLGADAGITYNGQQKTKNKPVVGDDTVVTKKAAVDFNIGLDVQYKGINKLALTAGVDFKRIGKDQEKDADPYTKAYNQFGVNVNANYNVANNIYVAANFGHDFQAQKKDQDGDKTEKVGGNTFGIAGTFQF